MRDSDDSLDFSDEGNEKNGIRASGSVHITLAKKKNRMGKMRKDNEERHGRVFLLKVPICGLACLLLQLKRDKWVCFF